jgi:hypothetical protein
MNAQMTASAMAVDAKVPNPLIPFTKA